MKGLSARVLSTCFSGFALLAAYQEILSAWSSYLVSTPTLERLEQASRITPLDSALFRQRGIQFLDTKPEVAGKLLRSAVAMNPFDAESLIALGLLEESGGRLQEAESYLSKATSISRRFKPKWALAFFYARQGPLDQFWNSARAAVNTEGADVQPVFALAHEVLKNDPEEVAGLLKLESKQSLKSYVEFLLNQESTSNLGRIALRLDISPESRPLLLTAVDRLIGENRPEEAMPLWNKLAATSGNRQLLPAKGQSLTNGQFRPPLTRGFDWRQSENQGIDLFAAAPENLRIEFSGRQSESVTLLSQFVPVVPNRPYKLSYRYHTSGLNGLTGLYWQAFQANKPATLPSAPLDLVSEGSDSLSFRTEPDTKLLRIEFKYTRPPGAMRLAGTVVLRSAELELL